MDWSLDVMGLVDLRWRGEVTAIAAGLTFAICLVAAIYAAFDTLRAFTPACPRGFLGWAEWIAFNAALWSLAGGMAVLGERFWSIALSRAIG